MGEEGGEGEIMRCVFRTLSRFMYVFMGRPDFETLHWVLHPPPSFSSSTVLHM